MNDRRQPGGTPQGGQFAASIRPEGPELIVISEGAASELRTRLRDFLAENGTPMRPIRDQYGWEDSQAKIHAREDGCTWVLPEHAVLEEESWSAFEDTYVENSEHIGVQIPSGVRCSCGMIEDTGLRWEGSFGALIRATTQDWGEGPTKVMDL